MLITSKTKKYDYMDSVASLGVDKTCVWDRESQEFAVKRDRSHVGKYDYNSFYFELENRERVDMSYLPTPSNYSVWSNKGDSINFERFYLGFCGETYKILIKYGVSWISQEVYFNPSDEEIENIEDKKHNYKPKRYREKQNEQPFNEEIFFKLRTPVFMYREVAKHLMIITNPILRDLGFYRIYDAYSAFQKISQYISGVLGATENPTIEVSDKDQLLAKGFDKKTSFRHPVR